MKNRTKTISLLLAVCMMLTLLPAVALADIMNNVSANITQTYNGAGENGWLKEVKITYTVGSGLADTDMKYGIQTYRFSDEDFTNMGDYYFQNHSYNDWSTTPPSEGYVGGIGFVAWGNVTQNSNSSVVKADGSVHRPGGGTTQTDTVTFDYYGGFTADAGTVYYVYGWANYYGSIYPDGLVCVFNVKNDGTFEQISDPGTSGGSTPTPTPTPTPSTSPGTTDPGNTNPTPTPDVPTVDASSGISLWYNGGNSFGSSKSAVPTSVEIDGVPVVFNGNGREFTVGCISPNAKWVTVNWNSTSVTTNFTPDANAACTEISLPKTGDVSVMAFALMAVVAAAGAMGKK